MAPDARRLAWTMAVSPTMVERQIEDLLFIFNLVGSRGVASLLQGMLREQVIPWAYQRADGSGCLIHWLSRPAPRPVGTVGDLERWVAELAGPMAATPEVLEPWRNVVRAFDRSWVGRYEGLPLELEVVRLAIRLYVREHRPGEPAEATSTPSLFDEVTPWERGKVSAQPMGMSIMDQRRNRGT